MWPHPLNCVHACVRLLFEGGYYFFGGAPGAATIRGAASIRINTVLPFVPTCRYHIGSTNEIAESCHNITS